MKQRMQLQLNSERKLGLIWSHFTAAVPPLASARPVPPDRVVKQGAQQSSIGRKKVLHLQRKFPLCSGPQRHRYAGVKRRVKWLQEPSEAAIVPRENLTPGPYSRATLNSPLQLLHHLAVVVGTAAVDPLNSTPSVSLWSLHRVLVVALLGAAPLCLISLLPPMPRPPS
jgi:hypothetical protein